MPIPAKILVVDDQAYVRRTLRMLLKQQPHWEVYEAENGRVAIRQVRELKPDVAVLDIVMPGLDGFQVLAKFRADADRSHLKQGLS